MYRDAVGGRQSHPRKIWFSPCDFFYLSSYILGNVFNCSNPNIHGLVDGWLVKLRNQVLALKIVWWGNYSPSDRAINEIPPATLIANSFPGSGNIVASQEKNYPCWGGWCHRCTGRCESNSKQFVPPVVTSGLACPPGYFVYINKKKVNHNSFQFIFLPY